MIILHTWVDNDPRMTSVDFRVNRLKFKVEFGLLTLYGFHTITLLPFTYNNDTAHMSWSWPKEDLYWFWGQKVKCQGQIQTLNFVKFPHNKSIYIGPQWWYLSDTCVPFDPRINPIDFWVKGQGQTCIVWIFLRWGYLSLSEQVSFHLLILDLCTCRSYVDGQFPIHLPLYTPRTGG